MRRGWFGRLVGGAANPPGAYRSGACLRKVHALARDNEFPDPFENSHQIGFNLTGTGIDQNSPRFKAANKTCQPLMPGGGP